MKHAAHRGTIDSLTRRTRRALAVAPLLVSLPLLAQQDGKLTPGLAARKATAAVNFQNTLTLSKCGLTYTQASAKLAKRNDGTTFPAVPEPAPLAISGIPANATIEKAYLWWMVEGGTTGSASVSFQSLAGPAQTVAATLTGSDAGGKCWGRGGTSGWRADVTSLITPPFNGTYRVSGLPVSAPGPDTDGVTLFIAYSVPGTGAKGTLVVNDGLIDSLGTAVSQPLSGAQAACQDATAHTFVLLSDFQQLGSHLELNGGPPTTFNEKFWNWEDQATPVPPVSPTTVLPNNSDCIGWQVLGLSSRCTAAECNPCQPVTINARKQYAAKFVCHRALENPLQVVKGYYGTTLNVHNPGFCFQPHFHPGNLEKLSSPIPIQEVPWDPCPPVRFAKKVAVALPGQQPGKISNFKFASLRPDQAFQVDCADILSIAGAPAGSFLEGFVVIESEAPLDVTAVYSARPLNGEVSALEIKEVPERDVSAQVSFCQ